MKMFNWVVIFVLFNLTNVVSASTINLSNYLAAGSAGDSWTYTFTDSTGLPDFTANLSSQSDGTLKLGDLVYDVPGDSPPMTKWSTYEVTDDTVHFHSIFDPFSGISVYSPPLSLPTSLETNTLLSEHIPTTLFNTNYIMALDSITVSAGTFNDVIVMLELIEGDVPNNYNTLFGLDPLEIPLAVSAISWYANGVGLVKAMDVDGGEEFANVEFSYELKSSTVVPIPGTIWLLVPGLLLLVGFNEIEDYLKS